MNRSVRNPNALGTNRSFRLDSKHLIRPLGALFVCCTLLCVWYFFSPSSPYYHKSRYVISFSNASGLKTGAEVLVNGLKMGNVEKVVLAKDHSKVLVTVLVPEDLNIPTNTPVGIFVRSLVGGRAVDLRIWDHKEPYFAPWDTIPGFYQPDPTQMMLFMVRFIEESKTSIQSIQHVLNILDSVQMTQKFDSLTTGIQKMTKRIQSTSNFTEQNLNGTLKNLHRGQDTALMLSKMMLQSPTWANFKQLSHDTRLLSQQLKHLLDKDQALWHQSAPRQQLHDSTLKPQILRTISHLDTLYSVLRKGQLELNPDLF